MEEKQKKIYKLKTTKPDKSELIEYVRCDAGSADDVAKYAAYSVWDTVLDFDSEAQVEHCCTGTYSLSYTLGEKFLVYVYDVVEIVN